MSGFRIAPSSISYSDEESSSFNVDNEYESVCNGSRISADDGEMKVADSDSRSSSDGSSSFDQSLKIITSSLVDSAKKSISMKAQKLEAAPFVILEEQEDHH